MFAKKINKKSKKKVGLIAALFAGVVGVGAGAAKVIKDKKVKKLIENVVEETI